MDESITQSELEDKVKTATTLVNMQGQITKIASDLDDQKKSIEAVSSVIWKLVFCILGAIGSFIVGVVLVLHFFLKADHKLNLRVHEQGNKIEVIEKKVYFLEGTRSM